MVDHVLRRVRQGGRLLTSKADTIAGDFGWDGANGTSADFAIQLVIFQRWRSEHGVIPSLFHTVRSRQGFANLDILRRAHRKVDMARAPAERLGIG
jgi:hypothetical protein